MEIISVENPVYSDASGDRIDCIVLFREIGSNIPFTACVNDSVLHSVEIYNRCKSGEFGPIADHVAPPVTDQQIRREAKAARQSAVEVITVTTAAGNTFDGDETSQTRMARAILVLSTGATSVVPWVLADNTVTTADIAELNEALALAGAAQAALWVIN